MLWTPAVELSPREETICSRLTKQRRFFPFLRRIRHRLFDGEFKAPAFLMTVVLLQAYTRCSDFDAVSNTLHDARWQMVLDCFDLEEAPFGEVTLVDFRARLVRSGMASEILRRTVDLARETKGFGFKQAAGLRIAISKSAPYIRSARV